MFLYLSNITNKQTAKEGVYKKIGDVLRENPDYMVRGSKNGLKRVLTENYIFIGEKTFAIKQVYFDPVIKVSFHHVLMLQMLIYSHFCHNVFR